jgi:hypothetical protein
MLGAIPRGFLAKNLLICPCQATWEQSREYDFGSLSSFGMTMRFPMMAASPGPNTDGKPPCRGGLPSGFPVLQCEGCSRQSRLSAFAN